MADPIEDHGHDHFGEDGLEDDQFVIHQEDLVPVKSPDAPVDMAIWDGVQIDPDSMPADGRFGLSATAVVPSTNEQLMAADTGYLAHMRRQGVEIDPASLPAPPPLPELPPVLDATPGWNYQYSYSCDPNDKPGMLMLAQLFANHYQRPTYFTSRACIAGGRSQHYEGRAFDWTMNAYNPTEKAIGDSVAQWLTANDGEMARRLGVLSIIWNQQAWFLTTRTWHYYDGPSPHTDHLHFSTSWDGAMGRTSWWTGTAVTAPDHGTCRVYQNQYAPRYTQRRTQTCPDNLPAPPHSPHPVVLPGAHNNYVAIAQGHLGFTGPDVDGKFGPMTLAALLSYQAYHQLPVTGVLDNATWHRMLNGGPPPPSQPPLVQVDRVAGADRYATAAALAASYPSGGDVYIATGADYADALSASARAGNRNAPVLLVQRTVIPAATRQALLAHQPQRIFVVGGTSSVSNNVLNSLRQYTTTNTATRIAGTDRYETAAEMARQWGTNVPVVYVVTGQDYPDAMTASARAARMNGPVLLTQRTNVPNATVAAMQDISPARVVVLGNTDTISTSVANQLRQLTRNNVLERVQGANRYETAAALAAYYPSGLPVVYVATGQNFPDALAGSARAGAAAGPVLLVQRNNLPTATREVLRDLDPGRIVIVGGSDSVTNSVREQLRRIHHN